MIYIRTELYLVDFDTRDNVLLNKNINHLLAISGGLVESLFKENRTRNVLAEARSCHQKGSVGLAVSLCVLQSN